MTALVTALAAALVLGQAGSRCPDGSIPQDLLDCPDPRDTTIDGKPKKAAARLGAFHGGAVVLGSGARAAVAGRVGLTLLSRHEANGFGLDAGRVEGLAGPSVQRIAFQLLQLDEVIVGERSGKPCLPAVFFAWPAGECEDTSGHFGLGVSLLEGNADLDSGRFALRVVELAARASLPHPAMGAGYQLFRLSPHLGASVDVVRGAWILRGSVGADLLAGFHLPSLELTAKVRWRPALTEFTANQFVEGSLQLAWTGPELFIAALELGGAWATRPETSIGAVLARDATLSWWVSLRFETTAKSTF